MFFARRTKARPSLIPSTARPSSPIPLTTTTTISLSPSIPTSNLTSLQLVSYYNCLFSQTHTHPPLKPSCRYNRVASPGSPCLKVRRARFRLPSPVLSVRRRHPPTATSQSSITTNRHCNDTAIARPLSVCHALICLSPIIPCHRLRLATPLHEHLPRHRPITSIRLAYLQHSTIISALPTRDVIVTDITATFSVASQHGRHTETIINNHALQHPPKEHLSGRTGRDKTFATCRATFTTQHSRRWRGAASQETQTVACPPDTDCRRHEPTTIHRHSHKRGQV